MITEPTAESKQRIAFEHLRENARNAHVAGDGLLVNLLCHSGLQRAATLAESKKLHLSLAELAWIPALVYYWLVDPSERYFIGQSLKIIPHLGKEDWLVGQWIDRYSWLIEQPLAHDSQQPALEDFQWPECWGIRTVETDALVSHMVELLWFRNPEEGRWNRVCNSWLQKSPSWLHEGLHSLQNRLSIQTRLTVPCRAAPLFPETAAAELRKYSDFAELWLLHLHGCSKDVCTTVERITPESAADSHKWRVLVDFMHINGRSAKPSEPGVGHLVDSEMVQLARRRRLSVETPLLIFHDKREEKITEKLSELFRVHEEAVAALRWDVYLLAMLHEIAALRLWDYGMWLEAVRAQAQTNLECVQWTDLNPEMSVLGLMLAVRGFCAKSPDKDPLVRSAINVIEFASPELLSKLAEGLLATYPKQKYRAAELLQDLTDLLPPQTWPDLARWTISYSRESSEQRTSGWRLAPATHWRWVLPVLPSDSSAWGTLQPEALATARLSICWRGEYGTFIQRWLLFAPTSLSREIAEAMTGHPETDPGACFARADCLIKYEERFTDIKGIYTTRLLSNARSVSEEIILARHLGVNDLAAREDVLRERITQTIHRTIALATPPRDKKELQFTPAEGIQLVEKWHLEDLPLLNDLIDAVNSPDVLSEYLVWLIQTIQLLVGHGPNEFAEVVQPHVARWTQDIPQGRSIQGTENGPLSAIHFCSLARGQVASILGWLTFQLPRKLGSDANADLLTWVRRMLLKGEPEALGFAVYGSASVSFGTAGAEAIEPLSLMKTAMAILWSKVENDSTAPYSLASSLKHVATLFHADRAKSFSDSNPHPTANTIEDILKGFLPLFAKAPQADLRSATAFLIWRMNEAGMRSIWIKETLTALQSDNRARVRFEAQGGYAQTRNLAA